MMLPCGYLRYEGQHKYTGIQAGAIFLTVDYVVTFQLNSLWYYIRLEECNIPTFSCRVYAGMPLSCYITHWGFPKMRGTSFGVPILRTMVFWGLSWGLPILGNYHSSYAIPSALLCRVPGFSKGHASQPEINFSVL